MLRTFQAVQFLPYPLEGVFRFFANPANLPRLMPAWQHARIDSATFVPPLPPFVPFRGSEHITAGNGTQLTLSFRPIPLLPLRLRWTAQIEEFRWLSGFCDIQGRGPFKYWKHCHTLVAEGDETVLSDSVTYELPFGAVGELANALVERQMASMFRYRHLCTLALLEEQRLADILGQ